MKQPNSCRRWVAVLTLASLPLIGVSLAPSSLADDLFPCGDMGSMSCLEFALGGAGPNGPCGWDVASMACLGALTAAGANCSQGGRTPTVDCMWSPFGGANYDPPAPTAPPLPVPGAPPTP